MSNLASLAHAMDPWGGFGVGWGNNRHVYSPTPSSSFGKF